MTRNYFTRDGNPIRSSESLNEPKKPAKKSTNINNLTISLEDVNQEVYIEATHVLPISDETESKEPIIFKEPKRLFNAASIPNSFDLFVDDLQHSSSLESPTELNSIQINSITNTKTSKNTFSYSKTLKILTSSVDKDLNKMSPKEKLLNSTVVKNHHNIARTNLVANKNLTNSNIDLNFDIKVTSSPFKPKPASLNQSYTIDTSKPVKNIQKCNFYFKYLTKKMIKNFLSYFLR